MSCSYISKEEIEILSKVKDGEIFYGENIFGELIQYRCIKNDSKNLKMVLGKPFFFGLFTINKRVISYDSSVFRNYETLNK